MSRSCLFCANPKLTREHVLPLWLSRLVSELGPGGPVTATREAEHVLDFQQWQADVGELKLRRVCEPCNTGWMRRLEDAVIPIMTPMIQGEARALSPTDQRIVAAWTVKTGLLFQCTVKATPDPPAHELISLYSLNVPSNLARVWLASYSGTGWTLKGEHHHLHLTRPADPEQIYHGELFTLGVYRLVLQALILPDASPIQIASVPDFDNFVVSIWPNPIRGVMWPPSASLTDAGFLQFAKRFYPHGVTGFPPSRAATGAVDDSFDDNGGTTR